MVFTGFSWIVLDKEKAKSLDFTRFLAIIGLGRIRGWWS
jgi:hypothetical protein